MPDARRSSPSRLPEAVALTGIYVAAALLVLAQLIGLYGLKTRKADLLFSVLMATMVVAALVLGGYSAYHRIHG